MGREILFRGKCLDNGEWVYGDLNHFSDGRAAIADSEQDWFLIDPATIGQYTGFKDRNGTPIFEGDIADHVYQAYPSRFFNRGIIFYDEEHARFAHMLQSMNPELGRITTEAWEVVGNIHDNPDLIGGGK